MMVIPDRKTLRYSLSLLYNFFEENQIGDHSSALNSERRRSEEATFPFPNVSRVSHSRIAFLISMNVLTRR